MGVRQPQSIPFSLASHLLTDGQDRIVLPYYGSRASAWECRVCYVKPSNSSIVFSLVWKQLLLQRGNELIRYKINKLSQLCILCSASFLALCFGNETIIDI